MSDQKDESIEPLGMDFEVIEDTEESKPPAGSSPAPGIQASAPSAQAASSPAALAAAATAAAAPAAAGAPASGAADSATPPPPGAAAGPPLRSVAAWTSFGLALALAGLIGPWGPGAGSNVLHGVLLAWTAFHLLRFGFAAVQPTAVMSAHPALAGLLVVYGGMRVAMAGSGAMSETLGWQAGTLLGSFGALFTLLGGVLALAAPAIGKKADAKLPPLPPEPARDKQFNQSLMAYVLVLSGMILPWASSGERGVDSVFGLVTLLFVILVAWASWVGVWKLWTTPVVTGKLGLALFLAPLEAVLLGLFGIIRQTVPEDSDTFGLYTAWPRSGLDEESFLVYGAGPALTLVGGAFALWVLLHGTKAAMEVNKQRKAEEIAARKAARDARKGGGTSDGAASGAAAVGDEKKERRSRTGKDKGKDKHQDGKGRKGRARKK